MITVYLKYKVGTSTTSKTFNAVDFYSYPKRKIIPHRLNDGTYEEVDLGGNAAYSIIFGILNETDRNDLIDFMNSTDKKAGVDESGIIVYYDVIIEKGGFPKRKDFELILLGKVALS